LPLIEHRALILLGKPLEQCPSPFALSLFFRHDQSTAFAWASLRLQHAYVPSSWDYRHEIPGFASAFFQLIYKFAPKQNKKLM
jgi:hypothetical protein